MRLEGSCHCGAVQFSLSSAHPYPYQRCYCSICRETQGGGGYSINLGGDAHSLRVRGRKQVAIYHAKIKGKGDRRAHLLLDSKASWVEVEAWPGDKLFGGYPEESIAQWHERLGLGR